MSMSDKSFSHKDSQIIQHILHMYSLPYQPECLVPEIKGVALFRCWALCWPSLGLLVSFRKEGHCKSIQLLWWITFILWWNTSSLMTRSAPSRWYEGSPNDLSVKTIRYRLGSHSQLKTFGRFWPKDHSTTSIPQLKESFRRVLCHPFGAVPETRRINANVHWSFYGDLLWTSTLQSTKTFYVIFSFNLSLVCTWVSHRLLDRSSDHSTRQS